MNQGELNCVYGSDNTKATLYHYKGWYVIEGSQNVNYTSDPLYDGVNVELLNDSESFHWDDEINSVEELIEAVED